LFFSLSVRGPLLAPRAGLIGLIHESSVTTADRPGLLQLFFSLSLRGPFLLL
ncbi:hypothetical protein NDU88_000117, partial [Pleurodeles waltl]